MVIQHDMPLVEMQKQLQKLGLRLDLHYILALRNKIFRERAVRLNTAAKKSALATLQDVLSETTHIAWQIVLSPQSTKRERLTTKAGKDIRNVDLVKELLFLLSTIKVDFVKIKAHQKATEIINYNIEVDKLSRQLVREAIRKL